MKWTFTAPTTNKDTSAIDPSLITGYQIGIRNIADNAPGVYTTRVGAVSGMDDTQVLAGLTPGASYGIAVRTLEAAQSSDWSTPEIIVKIAIPVPSAPGNFSRA